MTKAKQGQKQPAAVAMANVKDQVRAAGATVAVVTRASARQFVKSLAAAPTLESSDRPARNSKTVSAPKPARTVAVSPAQPALRG